MPDHTSWMTSSLARRSTAVSRSISAENPTGAPGGGGRATAGTGAARASRLGPGWKISPSIDIAPGTTAVIAEVEGPGVIEHLWLTTDPAAWRSSLLRFYWDGHDTPAIAVPLGDFFCHGWDQFGQVSSQMVAANPHGGFNSYWPMPFPAAARVTVENLGDAPMTLYYQIDLALGEIPEDTLWLHAYWARSNPVPRGSVHPLLDVAAAGHYVGCYLAWGSNAPGWWGEGEVKFYLDDDAAYPSICGTGTEDYFGGAWNFDVPGAGYTPYTTAFLGLNQIQRPDGLYASQQRFGMYRWHILDPIRFTEHLRVTVQALGIGPGLGNGLQVRYRQNQDDVASTALAYLDRPAGLDHQAPDLLEMEIR